MMGWLVNCIAYFFVLLQSLKQPLILNQFLASDYLYHSTFETDNLLIWFKKLSVSMVNMLIKHYILVINPSNTSGMVEWGTWCHFPQQQQKSKWR